MKLYIKFPDIIIILFAASLTFFTAFSVYLKPAQKTQVVVRASSGLWTFPIDAQEAIIAGGPLGDTIVCIKENRVWVDSSPCDNKTCVASGYLIRHGQWAACLPNMVLILIEGIIDDDVDIVAW